MIIDELLTYLFDGQVHPLAAPIGTWLASSRRFTNFVTTFRDKIRKKLRTTQNPETLLDLQLELETAYLLLREKSLSLIYEPEHSEGGRNPDFAVTFTTSLTFMLEVTRLRTAQRKSSAELQPTSPSEIAFPFSVMADMLADTICSKLGQLRVQRSNVLIVGVESLPLTQRDLQAAMQHVQQRAEGSDAKFLQRYGFRNRADFFGHYQRLSEILVRGSQLQGAESVAAWVNPQAKHPLPSKVRTALYNSHLLNA
jgi:hypothetical protein